MGVELRKLVIPRKKIKKPAQRKPSQTQKKAVQKTPVVKPSIAKKPLSPDSIITTKAVEKTDMSSRLKQKQDSVRASAEAGKFQHEPLVLEKATLDFNFDFGSSEVNEKTALYLSDLAKALKDNPELKIQLVGHTDNVGSEKFNLRLSQYRAQTMKDYLVSKGVEQSRIMTEGRGMKEPLNDNSTEEKRALNRRVELTILYEK